jgi:hypothetical protein
VDRTLRYVGLSILAAATWILIAGQSDWILPETADAWFGPLAKLGVISFLAGLVLGAVVPAFRWARRGRCVRCGSPTERGQSYCLDHLRTTVNDARDHLQAARSQRRRP